MGHGACHDVPRQRHFREGLPKVLGGELPHLLDACSLQQVDVKPPLHTSSAQPRRTWISNSVLWLGRFKSYSPLGLLNPRRDPCPPARTSAAASPAATASRPRRVQRSLSAAGAAATHITTSSTGVSVVSTAPTPAIVSVNTSFRNWVSMAASWARKAARSASSTCTLGDR